MKFRRVIFVQQHYIKCEQHWENQNHANIVVSFISRQFWNSITVQFMKDIVFYPITFCIIHQWLELTIRYNFHWKRFDLSIQIGNIITCKSSRRCPLTQTKLQELIAILTKKRCRDWKRIYEPNGWNLNFSHVFMTIQTF